MSETVSQLSRFVITCAIVASAAGLCFILDMITVPLGGILLVLQLALGVVSLLFNRICAVFAAIFSALSFNFLFTEPRYSLHMYQAEDIANLMVFIIISLLVSQLALLYRSQHNALRHARVQNGLLMSVSHDLRTPLSTIIGTLDTLKHFGKKLPPDEHAELVDGALNESRRLHRYIENLLQASRSHHTGKIHAEETVELNNMLHTLEKQFDTQRLRFQPGHKGVSINCVAALLQQALYNVIDNALRYSPPHLPVNMAYTWHAEQVVVTIRDHGHTVTAAMARQRFTSFFTSRSGDSGEGGIGLGLTVAKAIIEAHGGTIAMSAASPGCQVNISLPARLKVLQT